MKWTKINDKKWTISLDLYNTCGFIEAEIKDYGDSGFDLIIYYTRKGREIINNYGGLKSFEEAESYFKPELEGIIF
jgi:hypothetical protein